MANLAPDLKRARIERVESSEGRLTLFVEGVRQFGLRFGGRIIFEGGDRVEGSHPRLPSSERVLTGGFDVFTQRNEPGCAGGDLERRTSLDSKSSIGVSARTFACDRRQLCALGLVSNHHCRDPDSHVWPLHWTSDRLPVEVMFQVRFSDESTLFPPGFAT